MCSDNEIRKEFFEIERERSVDRAGDAIAYIYLYHKKSQYLSDSNFQDKPITSKLSGMVKIHVEI